MAEKILEGFLLRNITELPDIEMIINEMRIAVRDRASVAFKKLMEWQIERLVDEIALNQVPRPEKQSILEVALGIVRSRMFYAEKTMQKTEFNLSCGLQVFSVTLDKKPIVYMKIFAPNNIYTKAFSRIKELEPFDINSDDLNNKGKAKEKLYNALLQKYDGIDALTTPLLNYDDIKFVPKDLNFRPAGNRAADLAKEKVLNHLLSCYACDQQIEPYKLMEYTTFAFRRLKDKNVEAAIDFEKMNLERILPEITLELIVKTGLMAPGNKEPEKSEPVEAEDTKISDAVDNQSSEEDRKEEASVEEDGKDDPADTEKE